MKYLLVHTSSEYKQVCIYIIWNHSMSNYSEILHLVEYYYVTPVYFIFGLLGHLSFFCALYQQAKKEKAYVYQIFVVVSETCEIFSYVVYVVSIEWWSSLEHEGAKWFNSCYVCMRYTAHVSVSLVNAFITCSLLLSISMTIDRVLALAKPFAYKQLNHKHNQIITLSLCGILAFGTSTLQCFVYGLFYDSLENVYVININTNF